MMNALKDLFLEVERQRPQRINGALTDEARAELAALEAVAEAAREARKELVRPLKDGETLFTCTYRAKEILRVALEKAGR